MRSGGSATLTVAAALSLVLGAGCSGGVGDSCRKTADCGGDLFCSGPNDPPVCGMAPREQCASDADCFGSVCHAVGDSCSADGIGSECGPSCAGGVCQDGFRCNAGGACEPVPCDEGFACAAFQQCDPAVAHASGPVHARTPGCVTIACARDGDCPAGTYCTNEVCQSGPGSCREVQLVP